MYDIYNAALVGVKIAVKELGWMKTLGDTRFVSQLDN
jgi:hypothetical protein